MINYKINKIPTSWGKGVLTSILGTTVSIILTFGTSALIDSKMKADIQRQTAMMVIHDIDVCVDQMEEMAKEEEERNNAMQYVLAHMDQIASLPEDTLQLAMEMIADFTGIHTIFDDAKENIFKSSQDIWSNLDNMAFIDNMELFYRWRREMELVLASDPAVVYPISYEEVCQMRVNASGESGYELDKAAFLKEKLKEPKVKFYVDFSVGRVTFYREYAQKWENISDRNKFIMNISDEELAEYIKNSELSGSSVSKRNLIGQWVCKWKGTQDHYYEFQEKAAFNKKQVNHITYSIWNGEMILTITYGGTWNLKDDSLMMAYDPKTLEVALDTSHITYRPEMRDSIHKMMRQLLDLNQIKENYRKSLERHVRDTMSVTTNKSGDKIELVLSRSEKGVSSLYLKRVK